MTSAPNLSVPAGDRALSIICLSRSRKALPSVRPMRQLLARWAKVSGDDPDFDFAHYRCPADLTGSRCFVGHTPADNSRDLKFLNTLAPSFFFLLFRLLFLSSCRKLHTVESDPDRFAFACCDRDRRRARIDGTGGRCFA